MRRVITTIASLAALLCLVVGCGGEAGREADPYLEALHPEIYEDARNGNECGPLLDLYREAVPLLESGNRLLDTTFHTGSMEATSGTLAVIDSSEIRLAQLDCSDAPDQFATLKQATCEHLQRAFDRAVDDPDFSSPEGYAGAVNDQMEAIGCYED